MTVHSYRDLEVWKKAILLVGDIYRFTRILPDNERFGLISQMQRSAVSIPANIAEGCARESTREFLRFLAIARGSLAELETHIMITKQLDYLDEGRIIPLLDMTTEIGKMLTGLTRSLRVRLDQNH